MQCQGYFLQITLGTRVVKQLNRNKFIFNVKQLKMNKFIFDARQLKMNKFIKSFLQFIISTSSIHLSYPPYTPESFEQDLKSYSSYIVLFSNYQILIFMWSLYLYGKSSLLQEKEYSVDRFTFCHKKLFSRAIQKQHRTPLVAGFNYNLKCKWC